MQTKHMIIAVALIILALAGGFFAGMQYQKSQRAGFAGAYGTFQNGQMMRRFSRQAETAYRPVRGQVVSVDKNSITVKLPNGNSKIVVLSLSTQFIKSASAAASDVKKGDTIMVVGTQNSDGSVTATDVQINPPLLARPTAQ